MGLVFSVIYMMAATDGDAKKVHFAMRSLLRKSIFLAVIYIILVVIALAIPESHASKSASWHHSVWEYYALTGAIAVLMALDGGLLCWAIREGSPRAIGAAGLAQLLTALVYLAKEVRMVLYFVSAGGHGGMITIMIAGAALIVIGKFINAVALLMIWKRVNSGEIVLVQVDGRKSMIEAVDPPQP